MIVYEAMARDIDCIVSAAIQFAKTGYPTDVSNADHLRGVVRNAIDSDASIAAVLRDDGDFAGCFLASIGPNILTGHLVCAEIFFWVEPSHRGHGGRLLSYVTRWARGKGCSSLVLSAPEGAERASRLFMRLGFMPAEHWFRKEL